MGKDRSNRRRALLSLAALKGGFLRKSSGHAWGVLVQSFALCSTTSAPGTSPIAPLTLINSVTYERAPPQLCDRLWKLSARGVHFRGQSSRATASAAGL